MKQEYQSMLQAGIEKKYRMLEEEIQKDIVRRIQKAGKVTDAADWQLQRYMVLGHSTEDVQDIIRQAVGNDMGEVARMYGEVIQREYVRSKALYEQVNAAFVPYEQNHELQQLTKALIQQSNDELFNISKSLGFMVDMGGGRKVFTPLSEIYNGYLDNAITMMASGAFDYNTLVRKVVGEMTASGLRTVDYASGHSNRVDVAVRRAFLTGMGQLTGQISRMNGQVLGTDKYEVDWHPGARPDHSVWQGRVWTYQQLVDVCGLGSGPGLLGWNCRHTYYPFIDGISVRNFTDEWLEEAAKREAVKKPYKGKEYNLYEATQKQRQMETAMRAQREKAQLLQQAGADKEAVINAKCKYQAMLDEYENFSKAFNLPEQRERIYYDLRGRVAPSQRTYAKWKEERINRAKERAEMKRRADMRAAQKAASQKAASSATMEKELIQELNRLKGSGMADHEYAEYLNLLNTHKNAAITKIYREHADKISKVTKTTKGGVYHPADNKLDFTYPQYSDMEKYGTLAHEYGHYFDAQVPFSGLNFREMEAVRKATGMDRAFPNVASSSDEFLAAIRKDKAHLKTMLTDEAKKDMVMHNASHGVQDAVDGLFVKSRIRWGHGEQYYNRRFSTVERMDKMIGGTRKKDLQQAYKDLGLDASNQTKTKTICRQYEAASEAWANIMSAETCGGDALEYVKKYLPNSYEALINILKGV